MSDMAGELSDKQKQKLEQYEERIREQDSELEGQRKQLVQLSALVDEQQKEINSREDKLTEQHKVSSRVKPIKRLHTYLCPPPFVCAGVPGHQSQRRLSNFGKAFVGTKMSLLKNLQVVIFVLTAPESLYRINRAKSS